MSAETTGASGGSVSMFPNVIKFVPMLPAPSRALKKYVPFSSTVNAFSYLVQVVLSVEKYSSDPSAVSAVSVTDCSGVVLSALSVMTTDSETVVTSSTRSLASVRFSAYVFPANSNCCPTVSSSRNDPSSALLNEMYPLKYSLKVHAFRAMT